MKCFYFFLVMVTIQFSFADNRNIAEKPSSLYAEVYYEDGKIKFMPNSLKKTHEDFLAEKLHTLNIIRQNCMAFDGNARRKIPGGSKRKTLDAMDKDEKIACKSFLRMPSGKLEEKIAAIKVYNEYKCKYIPKYSNYLKNLNEVDTKKSFDECIIGLRKLNLAEAVSIREAILSEPGYIYNEKGNVMDKEELNKGPSNYELPSDPVSDGPGATKQ